jgi:hypothetical protein
MAIVQNTYTGNGSTTIYSFTFEYFSTDDVKVELNGALTTSYIFLNATQIQFLIAPANGVAIRIYRQTDSEETIATFFAGSSIRAQDLNDNFTQGLYIAQETLAAVGNAVAGDIPDGAIGTSKLADESVVTGKIGDGAVTSTKLANNLTLGGTTNLTSASFSGNVDNTSTGYFDLPSGTTGERPGTANAGMVRFNSTISQFEGHNGTVWGTIGGGAVGGGADRVFMENDNTVSNNYTISENRNAVSGGPVTIQTGVTITVPSTSNWIIV